MYDALRKVRSFIGLGSSEPPAKRRRKDVLLRDYLTPELDFQDAQFPEITVLDPVIPRTVTSNRRRAAAQSQQSSNKYTSAATSPFDPGPRLDRNRLPYHVELLENMHDVMRTHFLELLDD